MKFSQDDAADLVACLLRTLYVRCRYCIGEVSLIWMGIEKKYVHAAAPLSPPKVKAHLPAPMKEENQ
ncbi:MAG: hypothetical protein WCC08_16570 [Terrimicrobiaceae bacterium]